MDNILKCNERLDDLEIKNFKIIQDSKKFCFGMDAVLLSDFAKVKEDSTIIDFCTGNAIIPILLMAKTKPKKIFALEYQADILDMARRSIEYNKLQNSIELKQGDIKEIQNLYLHQSCDYVTCNPPYIEASTGLPSLDNSIKIAKHEIMCNLDDVIFASKYILKEKGSLYMVHRPNRLVDIISKLRKYKLEPKRIRFVHSNINSKANLVLIEAIKGANSWINIEAPLFVYDSNNNYTNEILKIYGKI